MFVYFIHSSGNSYKYLDLLSLPAGGLLLLLEGDNSKKYPGHTDLRFPGGEMYKRDGISLGMERQVFIKRWLNHSSSFFMPVTLPSLFRTSIKVSQSDDEPKCWAF